MPPWPADWVNEGPAFTISVLGILTDERIARGQEQACIAQLKTAGVIR